MKKSHFLAGSLLTLLSIFTIIACGKTNDPRKEPTQLPGRDTTLFLQIDQNGLLTEFPVPFAQWNSDVNEIKNWESRYESKLTTEQKERLIFTTTKQNELNPSRKYSLNSMGLLQMSILPLKAKLILENDEATIKPHILELLKTSGFELSKYIEGFPVFVNKEIKTQVIISTTAIREYIILIYAPSTIDSSSDNFKPIVFTDDYGRLTSIPYPFIDFNKGRNDIQIWEKEHGSTFRKTSNSTIAGSVNDSYKTNDPKKENELRIYTLADEGNGKLLSAQITLLDELVFDTSSSDVKLNDNFIALLENEGYRSTTKGDDIIFTYANDKISLMIIYVKSSKVAAISYTPVSDNTTPPQKGNYSLIMPSFDFGASFAEDGPIAKWEDARGFYPQFYEDLQYGNYLICVPKVGQDAPDLPYKIGSITYYPEYKDEGQYTTEDVIYAMSVVTFNDNIAVDAPEVKRIMKENSFTLLEGKENEYVNTEKNAHIKVKKDYSGKRTEFHISSL